MKRPASDPENLLPKDWDPELERDPAWDEMRALLRESNRPALGPEESLALARQSIAEARGAFGPAPQAPRPESFVAWLRNMLLGGGPGGQLVRFAALGTAAFALGRVGQAPPAEKAAPTVGKLPQLSTGVQSASLVLPAAAPAAAGSGARSVAIDRSAVDDAGQQRNRDDVAHLVEVSGDSPAWIETSNKANAWLYGSQASSGGAVEASPASAAEALQHFAYAEILRDQQLNPAQAVVEYRRVLRYPIDDELRALVSRRVQGLVSHP